MYNDPEWKNHNMWIALKLLKELRILHWNEFLYTLHCFELGKNIQDAISDIKTNKSEIDSIVFTTFDKNGNEVVLQDTCYSYLRSYLEEAGLIGKVSSGESKLLEESDLFYSQIGI